MTLYLFILLSLKREGGLHFSEAPIGACQAWKTAPTMIIWPLAIVWSWKCWWHCIFYSCHQKITCSKAMIKMQIFRHLVCHLWIVVTTILLTTIMINSRVSDRNQRWMVPTVLLDSSVTLVIPPQTWQDYATTLGMPLHNMRCFSLSHLRSKPELCHEKILLHIWSAANIK